MWRNNNVFIDLLFHYWIEILHRDFGMVMSSDYNLCWQFNSDQIRKTSLTTAYSGPRLGTG